MYDEDIQAQGQVQTPIEESLQGLGGPMTRARAKKLEFEAIKIQNILIIEGQ